MRHLGQVGFGSYEQISGIVMAGHMSIEVIRAFISKALMPLVFIRTFPSSFLFPRESRLTSHHLIRVLAESAMGRHYTVEQNKNGRKTEA